MPLDTTPLAEIGANAVPDVSGSQAKALTLSDLYDQNQLNKIKVNEAKTAQADMTYAKQILSGKDLTKLEDQNAAVAAITKRNPQLGMQLMTSFAQGRKANTEDETAQLELVKAKGDVIGGQLVNLKLKHDQLLAQGMNEQQIHDAMQNDVFGMVQTLAQAKLPNGQPLLNDQDRQIIQQGLGQGYSTAWVDSMVARSKQGQEALAQRLAAKKDAREEAAGQRQERREDRADAAQETRDRAERNQERRTDALLAAAADKRQANEDQRLDPETTHDLAKQYLAGDKSVFTSLGRGTQGAYNITQLRKAIREEAQAQGLSPEAIAAKMAEYTGYVAEQRSLGTRMANIQTASSEAKQMIDVARQASNDLPRSDFLPWSKLSQLSEEQMNNPKLAKLKASTLAVVNTWARAISPSGVPTVADKEHADSVLKTAQSQEAYNAVLDQFMTEIQASLNAPEEVKQSLHDRFVGKPSAAASGATGAAPPRDGASGAAAGPKVPAPPPGFVIQGQK